jgi:hypothetical protein
MQLSSSMIPTISFVAAASMILFWIIPIHSQNIEKLITILPDGKTATANTNSKTMHEIIREERRFIVYNSRRLSREYCK